MGSDVTRSCRRHEGKGRRRQDTTQSVEIESHLQSELGRLKSRLGQGQRDYQRSHDELQRLEGEIRQVEREPRTLNRVHTNRQGSSRARAKGTPLAFEARVL